MPNFQGVSIRRDVRSVCLVREIRVEQDLLPDIPPPGACIIEGCQAECTGVWNAADRTSAVPGDEQEFGLAIVQGCMPVVLGQT